MDINEPELQEYLKEYPNMVFEWVPKDENIIADHLSKLELTLQKQMNLINKDNNDSNQNLINNEENNELQYNSLIQISNDAKNLINSLVDEKLWMECKEHYIRKSESASNHGGLIINGKLVPKKRVKKKCREILESKNNGDWLNNDELNFLLEVLKYHPKYLYIKQKKIKKIRVFSSLFNDQKSFSIMFENGELQNVGINKCIHTPNKSFNALMQNWIETITRNSSIKSNISPSKIGKMFLEYLGMDVYELLTHPYAKNVWGAPGSVNSLFSEFYKFYIELSKIT